MSHYVSPDPETLQRVHVADHPGFKVACGEARAGLPVVKCDTALRTRQVATSRLIVNFAASPERSCPGRYADIALGDALATVRVNHVNGEGIVGEESVVDAAQDLR